MKFTDGFWEVRPGVRPLFAAEAREARADAEGMTVWAPTKRIETRGDVLNRPQLSVRYTAPMADVIRVNIEHFAGGIERGPRFAVTGDGGAPVVAIGPDEAVLTSGRLAVRVAMTGGWRASFEAEGRELTSSGFKSVGYMDTDWGRFVHEKLALGVGDLVYGLGERFGPLVKNGQSVDVWNRDGGTSSDQAYKNVPFLFTNAGYGIFVDHPELVSFEVASEAVSKLQFSVEGESLSYLIIYGPSPKEILARYTALTGRAPALPAWSYGLWLSTSFTTDYDEATVASFIDGMAQRDLPLSVFHFDCFWMHEFQWCDLTWDPEQFPDPAGQIARLHERGLRVCVWINPYIAQRSTMFAEGKAAGYLVTRADGSVWQTDQWQAGMGLVDFTNPDAAAWYRDKLAALMDMGVDCFKTDFGERVPTDVVWHDGSDPAKMHNYYAQLYNRCAFDLLAERRGEGEAVVFARSATTGGQSMPVHWGGDCESTFPSMAESLRGGLSLTSSGFGYWSHDIGGFEGTPDPAVFKRWLAFGLLSSHSRLHGSDSYRVPWNFDEEAVDVLRTFTKLKLRLMPYLLGAARQVSESGTPMMRPMAMEYPDDPACAYLDRQYHLGDALLVAPVMSADGAVRYYAPEVPSAPGAPWTNLLTGKPVAAGRWHEEQHGFESLPLLARPGSVLAWGAHDDAPEYDWADGVELRVYEPADGQQVTVLVPRPDGGEATFEVRREGDQVTATAKAGPPAWSLTVVAAGNEHAARATQKGATVTL